MNKVSLLHTLVDIVADMHEVAHDVPEHIQIQIKSTVKDLTAEICDTVSLVDKVRNVYTAENKLRAIKLYRDASGLTLIECKRYVERVCSDLQSGAQQKTSENFLDS